MTKYTCGWLRAVCLFLTAVAAAQGAGLKEDKTLSPYFAIEGGDPSVDRFPLKDTRVDVSVGGVLAHVTVTQTYVNDGERPINASYVFPASTRAAVHGMTMTVGEHVIRAKIAEREEAREEFDQAKEAGKSASLLEQQRPNVFSMDVANVMPGDVIDIELQYSELLVPTDGTYTFVYPTVVGPRYSEITAETDTDHDRWVQSPYLHEDESSPSTFSIALRLSTGIPVAELSCLTHETDIAWDGETSATVSSIPGTANANNRDFILKYRLGGQRIQSGLMLHEGEDENFFLLLMEPPEAVAVESIPPREYIFAVDVSGSMHGFPISVSKELLRSLIGGLRPVDSFNVILFAGESKALAARSLPATEENIREAIALIDGEQGGGGTRLYSALERALGMPGEEGGSRSIVVVTDGYISAERDVFDLIRENLGRANVFAFGIGSSVNRYLVEGIARAGRGEPFVVTDRHEAHTEASKLRRYIESPVLTGVSVEYDGFEVYDVEPPAVPDLLAKRPLQVFGKWHGPASGRITVRGTTGVGEYSQTLNVEEAQPRPEHQPLRYLWARTRVADLVDFNDRGMEQRTVQQVTSLGLKYDLLTPYTSFVAVHEVVRNAEGDGTRVVQPLPLPEGVSDLAVGGEQSGPRILGLAMSKPYREAPEPELLVLVLSVVLGMGGMAAFGRWVGRSGSQR